MNYIRHTRAAFELLASTADATPYHVSLYVALFRQWNEARFPADIVLFKDELMQAAHIGSPKTYRACLRDLTTWGLITYQPSHSEYRASRAQMHELSADTTTQVEPHPTQAAPKRKPSAKATSNPTARATSDPSPTQAVPPFDKPDSNLTTPLAENGTPFSRTAAAPEKKGGVGSEGNGQHSEPDDSDLTAQPQKEKVAPKRKSSGSPSLPGRGSGGGARRPEVLFADSELAPIEAFIAAFAGTDYELANLRYYHELVANWRQHGEPPRRRDWLATSKKFMLNDMQDGKLKLASSATYPRGSAGPLTKPSLEQQLMNTLADATLSQVAGASSEKARMLLAEMSVGLTKAQAVAAPKLFQVKKAVGEKTTLKLLAVIVKAFCDSVRVPNRPDAADIIEVADVLMNTYTHDSIKDIILAFKEARTSGKAFFQVLDQPTLFGIINDYFDAKAAFLVNEHRDRTARGTSANAETVQALGADPRQLLHHVADRIPADHPDRDQLRRRLSLTKAKEAHGLLTPEQAEQQRAAFRAARVPKERPDWQPSPEAQERIDKRNAAEDRAILARYRAPTPNE